MRNQSVTHQSRNGEKMTKLLMLFVTIGLVLLYDTDSLYNSPDSGYA